jgi:thioredoxin 1
MVIEVTDANFDEIVIKSDKPVVVDFGAEWCGPCHMIEPIVKELAEEYLGRAVMVKIDIDENTKTTDNYGIRNIPTLLFFKDGKQVDKLVGAVQKKVLAAKLDSLL